MPERNKHSYSLWGPKELRDKRTDMGMTKRDLAKKLGVSERQYAYYESGHTKIDKPLEYAVRWLHHKQGPAYECQNDHGVVELAPGVVTKAQGTLTAFQKERIQRLLNGIRSYPIGDLDERGQKILSQCVDEISILTSHLSES